MSDNAGAVLIEEMTNSLATARADAGYWRALAMGAQSRVRLLVALSSLLLAGVFALGVGVYLLSTDVGVLDRSLNYQQEVADAASCRIDVIARWDLAIGTLVEAAAVPDEIVDPAALEATRADLHLANEDLKAIVRGETCRSPDPETSQT